MVQSRSRVGAEALGTIRLEQPPGPRVRGVSRALVAVLVAVVVVLAAYAAARMTGLLDPGHTASEFGKQIPPQLGVPEAVVGE